MSTTDKTPGQIGYEAYGGCGTRTHEPWKTFDGRPMPTWNDLGETESGRSTRERWEAAAMAIAVAATDAP